MSCLGLDIGGANLKAAHSQGWARSLPFALWRDPQGLSAALRRTISDAPPWELLAVTMTGELCDCFESKARGVEHIFAAVCEIAPASRVQVYLTNGEFASLDEALSDPLLAAASNWRALAEFACRYFDGRSGLLIDVGSTTTDIIPIVSGVVAARGTCDTERLACGELVYSGISRTPVCAVVHLLPWRGEFCPVAAELFATTADAYVLLRQIPEDATATWTADGRPLMYESSRQRLARQICTDASTLADDDFIHMAEFVRGAQLSQMKDAVAGVVESMDQSPQVIVVSGAGEFLIVENVLLTEVRLPRLTLSEVLGFDLTKCAPAYAVAALAEGFFFQKCQPPKISKGRRTR
ncbi:MAG: hydantoinase/oxoprolinase family protein [Pirellulales bacterium]